MSAFSPSPAPAVGRGAVATAYYGTPVVLSFGLNCLLDYTEAAGSSVRAVTDLLETNPGRLVRGFTHAALVRGLRGPEAPPPADDEATGAWLESLEQADDPAAGAIGLAIGRALTVPNPTLAGLQQVLTTRLQEMAAAMSGSKSSAPASKN